MGTTRCARGTEEKPKRIFLKERRSNRKKRLSGETRYYFITDAWAGGLL
jgi:hypothetical protein